MRGRPEAFHIGQMRHQITIQSSTTTLSDNGQPMRTWSTLYLNQPAKWMPTAGTETTRGRSVEAGISCVFTIREQPSITPEMQVIHSSGTYGIGYVKPVDGYPRYTELHCKQALA